MLSQQRMFITRTYELREHGVLIQERNLLKFSEFTLPYEDISFQTSRSHSFREDFGMTFVVSTILSCIVLSSLFGAKPVELPIVLLMVTLAVVFGILTVVSKKKLVRIELYNTNPPFLILREDKPSDVEVEKFMEDLFTKVRSYLKEKYIDIDNNLPKEEQAVRLRGLYERNVLSKEEYDALSFKMKYE